MNHRVFCWKDKETWPLNWPGCKIEPDSEEARDLAVRLEQQYSSFVAYHACRPVDVSSYYRDGLRVACHSDLARAALEVFASGQFPELSRDDVLAASEQMSDIDDDKLYVMLDDRDLIEYCGHYLIYGSEYLTAIAAHLSDIYGCDYRQHLKSMGRATVFEVELPFEWMPEEYQMCLASDLSRAVFHDEPAHEIDFTVTLSRPVPPECIRSHQHPMRIRDPFLGLAWHEEQEADNLPA